MTATDIIALDRVWAGHDVPCALLEAKGEIYVAYFDAMRQLTLAQRQVGSKGWRYTKLDSWVGWDSHNHPALGMDAEGRLHIAANMHGDRLNYWMLETPGELRSVQRRDVLVEAARERSVTYPKFLRGGDGQLIFSYRDGESGRGSTYYVAQAAGGTAFAPLLSTPLCDGEGLRNAYPWGPVRGPDGWFHMAWVWRDSPDAGTNHNLNYAKSADLLTWQTAAGAKVTPPFRLKSDTLVDAVPVGGGMINNNTVIGFDASGAALIAYHKFDEAGQTQIVLARWAGNAWSLEAATEWGDFRWDFGGEGSLDFRLVLEPPMQKGDEIHIPFKRDAQWGIARVQADSGRPLGQIASDRPGADVFAGRFLQEGMQICQVMETWSGRKTPVRAVWAALPANRDEPRDFIPEPTTLYLALPRDEPDPS